jgi:hypothetical protein
LKGKISPILILLLITGSAGIIGATSDKERALRGGDIPSAKHTEWVAADRCTKCHMAWSWEEGYYRAWDRYGFISDYFEQSPFAYKDPFGLDVPKNPVIEYYYSDWWNGPWLKDINDPEPQMHLGGYYKVNNGDLNPGDFGGKVIVVDKSGKSDAKTIQEGVDKAKPGMTVFVKAGKYIESVRLKPGIRLWGENPHTTIIDSDLLNSAIIAANNCDISGFTLTGTGMNYKDYEFSAGIFCLDSDSTLVIHGNIFNNNAVYGVIAESSLKGKPG